MFTIPDEIVHICLQYQVKHKYLQCQGKHVLTIPDKTEQVFLQHQMKQNRCAYNTR